MMDETRSWGIEVSQVIAAGGYWDTDAFRLGLEERGLDYVVGISTMTTRNPRTHSRAPRPTPAGGHGPFLPTPSRHRR
ncbi:transposase [Streptomyces sp. NPDC051639]|uniref:transposase n=1 Tax=Streptomyces sp. NPDC051639 TaxID=3155671 RepID=UPI00343D291B